MFKLGWAALVLLALTKNAPAQSPEGAEARLKKRNITLPSAPAPAGSALPCRRRCLPARAAAEFGGARRRSNRMRTRQRARIGVAGCPRPPRISGIDPLIASAEGC